MLRLVFTMTLRISFYFGIFLSTAAMAEMPALEKLPRLNVDARRITVSGVSSGAYFAVQFHLAHSNLVRGVGAVAGGIYWCAEGDAKRAQTACMSLPKTARVDHAVQKAKDQADAGLIDPLNNLHNDRIYIFASPKDSVINSEHANLLAEFYANFTPKNFILQDTHPTAAHGFLTNGAGNVCGKNGIPWLQNCQKDMADEILSALDEGVQTSLQKDLASRAPNTNNGQLIFYDQSPFSAGSEQLFAWGAIYVPQKCQTQSCGLHLAFHGCQMNPDFISEQFIRDGGYLAAAERHQVVILFPQAGKSQNNPYGCWDWFGLYDQNYINQNGAQIKAVYQMLEAVRL